MPKWVQQWKVQGSAKDPYTVSRGDDGTWACSCIGWVRHMPRKDCKHIKEIIRKNVTEPSERWVKDVAKELAKQQDAIIMRAIANQEPRRIDVTVTVRASGKKPTRRKFNFEGD